MLIISINIFLLNFFVLLELKPEWNGFKYTKEILEPLVKRSKSWKDFIENKLGLVYCNGSKQSFYKILKKIDINYNHFSDTRLKKSSKYKNEELFTTNSIIDRTIIRSRIIK